MAESPVLFEEIFETKLVNPDGKTFEKVTRFVAHSVTYGMDLIIDINTDVYPLLGTDRFSLALASTLYKDNRPDPGVYTNYSNEKTLMDDYEYCMYGKVFQYQYKDDGNMFILRFGVIRSLIYVSFGGLLMSLEGDMKYIQNIKYGDRLYCLIRRVH